MDIIFVLSWAKHGNIILIEEADYIVIVLSESTLEQTVLLM